MLMVDQKLWINLVFFLTFSEAASSSAKLPSAQQ